MQIEENKWNFPSYNAPHACWSTNQD